MTKIFDGIKECVKQISTALKYSDFSYANSTNKTGDVQLKLDILSDEIITDILSKISNVKALISEEKDEILNINENAKYIIAYDPLDGSSLVDVNFAIGSIFGIYENTLEAKNLVASVYSVYGPRCELVITANNKVELFRLDKDENFAFTKQIQLKEKGNINATGGLQKEWSKEHKELVNEFFTQGYRLRYSGAMVGDLHQILLKGGGIFSYPATSNTPNGKLRLAFEVLPFALTFKVAGGEAIDNMNKDLLSLNLVQTHQTSPCYFGSKYEIQKVKECLKK